ncbi:MAG: Gfo/Idh/MocA family oxidoreductase [bacterium]
MQKIKVGVVGVGYLGKYHVEKYAHLPQAKLVGIVDINPERAAEVSGQFHVPAYTAFNALLGKVDAVSIVAPTNHHHEIAKEFLKAGVDVLIEKPITTTLEEADELIDIAKSTDCIFQVGHLERFNPAITALKGIIQKPGFIESHRLAPFKDRGTEVDVILDIMIHDIDIILTLVGDVVTSIQAVGVPVISHHNNDIANVRLEFATGCIANVTASRISAKEMRKLRIFQQDTYISIDYGKQQVEMYTKMDSEQHTQIPLFDYKQVAIKRVDSLEEEIKSFLKAVEHRTRPTVSGEDGRNALSVALKIVDQIKAKRP